MAFTYNPSSGDNVSRIRLAIGDINADNYRYDDADISLALTMVSNDVGKAADLLRRTELSAMPPDTKADWAQMMYGNRVKALIELTKEEQVVSSDDDGDDTVVVGDYTYGTSGATYRRRLDYA